MTDPSGHSLVLGRYEIERRLASGGMGELFLALDRSPTGAGRPVVVKQLKEELRSRPNVVRQFVAEATIARRMKHPHIAEVLDCGSFGGLLMMVMEYLEGVTLAQVIGRAVKRHDKARGVLPVAGAQVVRQIALALDYAHHLESAGGKPMGIVHRDINPGNIMICAGGAKLIDFGIAKAGDLGPQTSADVVKGTLGYLAPEQVTAEAAPDARTDQFQLGVVFWEALCGRYLYPAKSPYEQLQKISAGVMKPPSSCVKVPAALDRIVMRMLARAPAERFDRLSDVADALEQLARDEGWTAQQAAEELALYTTAEADSGPLVAGQADSPEAMRCVACGAPIDRKDAECRVCGIELRTAISLLSVSQPTAPSSTNVSSAEHIHVSTEMLVAPFVGRGYPLAVAGSTIREATIGLIRTTTFLGDHGSGKSTLLRRASELAGAAGLRCVEVAGRDLPPSLPYDLARQVLETLEEGKRMTEALHAFALPEAQRAVLDAALHGAPSPLVHRNEEQRTRDAAVRDLLLHTAQRHGGLALLIDDAEWLDPASQRVLRQLASAPTASDTPLAVLVCAQPTFDAGEANVVDLLPLTAEECSLLAHLTCDERVLAHLDLEQLRRRAAGNPAALVHLLHGRTNPSTVPTFDPGALGLEDDDVSAIDAARTAVLEQAPQTQAVLKWAAAVGATFDEELLNQVLGDAYDTRAALEQARAARLVVRRGAQLQFVRAATRHALVSLTSAQEQRWIAQRLARALAAAPDRVAQQQAAALLASIGGGRQQHRASLAVARAVRDVCGDLDAVRWFRDAFDALVLQDLQPATVAELDGLLVEVKTLRSEALLALADPIKRALKRLEGRLPDGRSVQLLCALTRAGDVEAHEALQVAGAGEAALPDRARIELALVRLEMAARAPRLPANFDDVLHDVTQALVQQPLAQWLAWQQLGRCAALAVPPRSAVAAEALEAALAAAERTGSGPGLFLCHLAQADFALNQGSPDVALASAAAVVSAAQAAGDRAAEIEGRLLRSRARLLLGDRGRARYDLEMAGQLAIQLHWRERATQAREALAALPMETRESFDLPFTGPES